MTFFRLEYILCNSRREIVRRCWNADCWKFGRNPGKVKKVRENESLLLTNQSEQPHWHSGWERLLQITQDLLHHINKQEKWEKHNPICKHCTCEDEKATETFWLRITALLRTEHLGGDEQRPLQLSDLLEKVTEAERAAAAFRSWTPL